MADIPIQQAILSRGGAAPSELRGRSSGFADAWLPEAQRLAQGFGERPDGVRCPRAVFAKPLGGDHVAVVQVGDQPGDGGAPALGFHFLVLPRLEYVRFFGDPFFIAEQFPPTWHLTGDLPALSLANTAQPRRTVAMVQRVLQRVKAAALPEGIDPTDEEAMAKFATANAESPALLGGVQVLVDGGKLVFERPEPDHGLMSGLWTLLPNTTRGQLWPATFAFGNALGFDALVVPKLDCIDRTLLPGFTLEEQAADYPQGRYELQLQTAAEGGDQQELDLLFARRSWNDTWRLAVQLLVVIVVLAVGMNLLLTWTPPAPPPKEPTRLTDRQRAERASTAAGVISVRDPFTASAILIAGDREYRKESKKKDEP
jgi:hypothetical protein